MLSDFGEIYQILRLGLKTYNVIALRPPKSIPPRKNNLTPDGIRTRLAHAAFLSVAETLRVEEESRSMEEAPHTETMELPSSVTTLCMFHNIDFV